MRIRYPNVLLNGDYGNASLQFYNGLRFSNHCEYKFNGFNKDKCTFQFPHISEAKKDSYNYADYIFNIQNNYYSTGKIENFYSYNFIESFVTEEFDLKEINNLKQIDYIRQNNGKFEYVCSLTKKNFPFHKKLPIEFFLKYCNHDIEKNFQQIHSICVDLYDLKEFNKICFNLKINHVSYAWNIYRSIGINLPLLLIQVKLGRTISTLPMVDEENLSIIDVTNIKYNLSKKKEFWFDLDETLICRNMPVFQMINLLKILLKKGKKVSLLTRHDKNISSTLTLIKLSIKNFNNVIKVEPREHKSTYVGKSDVFIDNEYPQRLDVRKNSGAMALDLDQIDFIDSDYI